MTAQPQRRTTRKTHLDASAVTVEVALLARAGHLEQQAGEALGTQQPGSELLSGTVLAGIAQEFRALADELHWH